MYNQRLKLLGIIMKPIIYLFILTLISPLLQANTHNPQQFLQSIKGKPQEGEHIAAHYCLTCHAKNPLISIGAPPIADKNAWEIRLKQEFKTIFEHCDEGFGAMPARGGCFECSDEQLILAIVALLPEKDQKRFKQQIKPIKNTVR